MFTKPPGGKAGRRENPRNCHHLIFFTRLPSSMLILFSILLVFSRFSTAATESNVIFSRFSTATTESNVKAMFIFGDSIVDSGNNDFLDTNAKSNYFPYGVDFPLGRFTNGRTSADILGQLLGLPHLLPTFNDPQTKGSSILAGVNYASAGAGILDSTRQSRAYDFGARKFVVFNLVRTGCAPFFKLHNNGSCADSIDEGSTLFNNALRPALENLTEDLPGFSFVYINTSGIVDEMIDDPTTYGMQPFSHLIYSRTPLELLHKQVSNQENSPAILGLKPNGTRALCLGGIKPCLDRSIYVYYDGLHLTETIYMNLATKAYSSELQTEAYPFNVEVLANLNISLMLTGAPSFHTRMPMVSTCDFVSLNASLLVPPHVCMPWACNPCLPQQRMREGAGPFLSKAQAPLSVCLSFCWRKTERAKGGPSGPSC
ncbi:hypothetical protein EJ110_NYTH15790 [Nymphaea thermarum]|nr:hypothetical protein EJ110_NYTH15790 [Nymphaea thermarum]